ncbi:hypothetical protein ACFLT9_12940 [Acidobacteriota bacterium]
MDQVIDRTLQAGLKYFYHPHPFETWGHFKLLPDFFPNGIDGLKKCVDKASEAGLKVGVHTLSNFITTNDPYVTPVPDPRLARVGSSALSADITSAQTVISIEDPKFFNQMENNTLKTVVVGEELIRYGGVSEEAPWNLLNCVRGAFGTTTSAHQSGETIGKLIDHPYKVFHTDAELLDEMAGRIADLFNRTGLRQISFDGLEGCWSSGLGQYGRTLFVKKWFDSLIPELQGHVINDASNPGHYFWHIYTRMNWGEPWYAGFRESQTQLRLKNQEFFQRNLMPAMLGWFKLTAETSFEDIEWLLARSAGFEAGYALSTDLEAIEENGLSDRILSAIQNWERFRMADAFPSEIREELRDIGKEFHLESINAREARLYPIRISRITHEKREIQPGQPSYSQCFLDSDLESASLQFLIQVTGDGDVSGIELEIDNFDSLPIPGVLKAGWILKYDGGDQLVVYDKTWKKIRALDVGQDRFTLVKGRHSIQFDCQFSSGTNPQVKAEFRLFGEPFKIDIQ